MFRIFIGLFLFALGFNSLRAGGLLWETNGLPAAGARALVELTNGAVLTVWNKYSSNGVRVACARSEDAGQNWTETGTITQAKPGTDVGDGFLLRLRNGELWYSYRENHLHPAPGKPFTYSIRIAVSQDEGRTWQPHSIVATSSAPTNTPSRGLWSSCLLEKSDGAIVCVYDDELTPFQSGLPGHQWLTLQTWQPVKARWDNAVTVARAHGREDLSRDGMPALLELAPGRLLCVFESVQTARPHANLIRSVTSTNGGQTWSWITTERAVVFQPAKKDFMAVSPHVLRRHDGSLLCAFATDEDRATPDQAGTHPRRFHMDIKTVTSADLGQTWTTNAATLNSSEHRDYLPGLLEFQTGPARHRLLCLWYNIATGPASKRTRAE